MLALPTSPSRPSLRNELRGFLSAADLAVDEHPTIRGADGRPLLLVGPSGSGAPHKLALHALSTPRCRDEVLPTDGTSALALAWEREQHPLPLVHLWEDQWRWQNPIVSSRLLAMAGRSRRTFARKTRVARIDAATLEGFLREHHLWGPTQARFRYGLFSTADDALVAVASFSPRRHVQRAGERYRSHELIRFCSRRGESVVGGISKLLAAFVAELAPDDVVTVVDRDWGAASGWASLGFEPVNDLPPATFFVDPDGRRCHAMGTGRNPHRRQVPEALLDAFRAGRGAREARAGPGFSRGPGTAEDPDAEAALAAYLQLHGYYAVHDAGARRLALLLKKAPAAAGCESAAELWAQSSPNYPEKLVLRCLQQGT